MKVLFSILLVLIPAYSWSQETRLGATIDSTYSSEIDKKLKAAQLDDPTKSNIVIGNFESLVSKAVKISLPISIPCKQVSFSDTSKQFFLTKSFFEKYLDKKPLSELLNKKDKLLSWAGYENEIWNTENEYYDISDAQEVIEFAPIAKIENDKGVFIFYLSQWTLPSNYVRYSLFGGNLVIFDSSGHFIDGFEAEYRSGNSHGQTVIKTHINSSLKITVEIEDWADKVNPNGHKIITTYELVNGRLKRTSYTRKSGG
jgi:hypothetical protein